jgi:DNA polymerase-3 subunit epsilon
LLNDYGWFHNGHRAIDDCLAVLALLASKFRESDRLVLSGLLESARKPMLRVWAVSAPIETKDILKGRGYRWSAHKRCWYAELEEQALEEEQAFLLREIYRGNQPALRIDRIAARDRFSSRTNPDQ